MCIFARLVTRNGRQTTGVEHTKTHTNKKTQAKTHTNKITNNTTKQKHFFFTNSYIIKYEFVFCSLIYGLYLCILFFDLWFVFYCILFFDVWFVFVYFVL
jgi:hypothetical protein